MSEKSETLIEKFDLDNEPFIKSLLKKSDKLYFTKSGKLRTKLNKKDLYQKDLLEISTRIHSTIRILEHSRFFLEERKITSENESSKISNSEFLRYHIEAFFIRLTAFKDLIFKLINRTYDLKINENIGLERRIKKYCERENISEIKTIIEGLEIIMKKFTPVRNSIAHGEYYSNSKLSLIESIEITKREKKEEIKYDKLIRNLINESSIIMHTIELMICSLTKLAYSQFLETKKKNEKLKTTANNV